MDSRDYTSHLASPDYEDDDVAEEHPGLAILVLRVLTVLFGLFVLLPVVLFSPFALLVCAIVGREKESPVTEVPVEKPGPASHQVRVVPASIEDFAVELIAG